MTQAPPPAEPSWSAADPSVAAAGRPGTVTAAGITLIVLGGLTLLLGLFAVLGAALFAGAAGGVPSTAEVPGMGMFGAFAGVILVIALLVLGLGALQLIAGVKVLAGRGWARTTGIVVGIIGGVLALTGLGDPNGIVISLALLIANAFVVYALVTGGSWFGPRPASPEAPRAA